LAVVPARNTIVKKVKSFFPALKKLKVLNLKKSNEISKASEISVVI
jgi:hypothetical protein